MATGSGDNTLFRTAPPWAQAAPTAWPDPTVKTPGGMTQSELDAFRYAIQQPHIDRAQPEPKVDNTAQVMKDFADLQVLQEAIDDVIRNPRLSRSKPLSETLQHLTGYLHIQKIKLEAKIPKKSSDAQCEGGS